MSGKGKGKFSKFKNSLTVIKHVPKFLLHYQQAQPHVQRELARKQRAKEGKGPRERPELPDERPTIANYDEFKDEIESGMINIDKLIGENEYEFVRIESKRSSSTSRNNGDSKSKALGRSSSSGSRGNAAKESKERQTKYFMLQTQQKKK